MAGEPSPAEKGGKQSPSVSPWQSDIESRLSGSESSPSSAAWDTPQSAPLTRLTSIDSQQHDKSLPPSNPAIVGLGLQLIDHSLAQLTLRDQDPQSQPQPRAQLSAQLSAQPEAESEREAEAEVEVGSALSSASPSPSSSPLGSPRLQLPKDKEALLRLARTDPHALVLALENSDRRSQRERRARRKAEKDKKKAERDKEHERQVRIKAEEDKQKAEEDKQQAERDKEHERQARIKAEEDKQKAERELQSTRCASFDDLCRGFDKALLVTLRRNVERNAKRAIATLYQDKGLPHTLSPDRAMHDEAPHVVRCIRALLADIMIDALADAPLARIEQTCANVQLRNEITFQGILHFELFGSFNAAIKALATRIVELQSDASARSSLSTSMRQALDDLTTAFPCIVWDRLTQGFRIDLEPPPRIESAPGATKERRKNESNTPRFHPDITTLKCDVFFTLPAQAGAVEVAFHMCEVKAYSLDNSDKLREFFQSTMPGEWRTIDVQKLVDDQALDVQALAAISQCASYIPAHRTPLILLTTGLTNVFLRYKHTKKCPLQGQPIDFEYFVLHAPTVDFDQAAPAWKPFSLFDGLLYSLLRGLDDSFDTSIEQRLAWSNGLAEALCTVEQFGFVRSSVAKPDLVSHDADADRKDGNDGQGGDEHGAPDPDERDDQPPAHGRDRGRGGGHGAGPAQRQDRGRAGGAPGKARQGPVDKHWISGSPSATLPLDLVSDVVETAAATVQAASELEAGDTSVGSVSSESSAGSGLSSSTGSMLLLSTGSSSSGSTSSLDVPPPAGSKLVPVQWRASTENEVGVYYSASPGYEWDGRERYLGRSPDLITRQWCSTACLVGLKYGLRMDARCANVHLHCTIAGCTDHSKHGHTRTADEVRADIVGELRYGRIRRIMEPILLDFESSKSRLFRVLHPELGYAFAGKGAPSTSSDSLQHEHAMYDEFWRGHDARLGLPVLATQGGVELKVAVSFGVVEPRREFCDVMYPMWSVRKQLDLCLACNTFLLLSYHGLYLCDEKTRESFYSCAPAELRVTAELSSWCRKAVLASGVLLLEWNPQNTLWCTEQKALVLVDFENARLRNA